MTPAQMFLVIAASGFATCFAISALYDIANGIHRIATVLEELDKKKEGE